MDNWLKALVGATCVAVIAAVGWWGWTEYQSAQERAEMERTRACISEKMSQSDEMTAGLANSLCQLRRVTRDL